MTIIPPMGSGRPTPVERGSTGGSAFFLEGWKILLWIGIVFLVMGMIDVFLTWYPTRFGAAEWEFGTISGTMTGLVIPTLALYLILASAIARQSYGIARGVAMIMIVLAVALVGLGILYLTSVPLALRTTAPQPLVHLGMKKAIVKTMTLGAGYEILYVIGALKGLRFKPPTT